ncbi:MAG: helix-turn-helix domain-containing protein [Acutalibacteraceae bacterium]
MHILVWNMRKYRRMTLVGLAEKSGISKTTLNNIENEKVWPTILQLEQIAKALHVHINDLFDSPYR